MLTIPATLSIRRCELGASLRRPTDQTCTAEIPPVAVVAPADRMGVVVQRVHLRALDSNGRAESRAGGKGRSLLLDVDAPVVLEHEAERREHDEHHAEDREPPSEHDA